MTFDIPHKNDMQGLRALWKDGFGDGDEFLDSFFNTAFSQDRCRILRDGSIVAAALYWFDCSFNGKKIAYIYAVATLSKYRGRGLCHKLMENTENLLKESGYAGVVLVPGSEGLFAFYERLGYKTSSHIGYTVSERGDSYTQISRIDAAEYALLRRKLLPSGGVIQEGENLAFLAAMAEFYSGDGFLLAAQKEGKTLHGMELLGRCADLGGIVHALGCEMGKFRIPGGDVPFAMAKMFDGGEAEMPDYFGLAFD